MLLTVRIIRVRLRRRSVVVPSGLLKLAPVAGT